ncbi:MAG: hypothetical protein ACJ8R9_08590 [Steroidobacteraceae bacterium]
MKLTFGKSILAGVLIVVAGMIAYDPGYPMWRAYQGICEKTGSKLTTAQRLNFALDDYLVRQEIADLLEIGAFDHRDHPSIEDLRRDFTVIPYSSREEFLATNPQCCQLIWLLVEGMHIDAWAKAANSGDGFFDFKHRITYADRQGTRRQITSKYTYWQVRNCGEAQDHFYH